MRLCAKKSTKFSLGFLSRTGVNQTLFESVIRHVEVFKTANDNDIQIIASLGIQRSVEEGGYFFFQGDPANYLYIMLSGRAKLCQIAPNGHQVNLRTLNPNQLFGAVDENATYPACAQALDNSSAIAIRSTDFRILLEKRPHLSFGLMNLMTGYIQEMQKRYRELATERVEQRIARVLLRLDGSSCSSPTSSRVPSWTQWASRGGALFPKPIQMTPVSS